MFCYFSKTSYIYSQFIYGYALYFLLYTFCALSAHDLVVEGDNLFFYKHTAKLGIGSICLRLFSQFEPEIRLNVCLISVLISWPDIAFGMNTAMISLTVQGNWYVIVTCMSM